jgi:glycosyltransferase involved in cell wall biosynthesis
MFNSKILLPVISKRFGEGGLRLHGKFKSKVTDEKPLVTIITVVFNGVKTIERTINSIANQTYDNIEFIIIDGGSTDGTLDILHRYEHNIDYWVSEMDQGIYDAFNKAITCSSGDWICFIGADDFLWTDAVIANLAHTLSYTEQNVKLVYNRIAIVNSQQELIYVTGEPWAIAKPKLRYKMSIPHQGLFYRRSWFDQYGLFDTTFRIAGDYENFLRGQPHENAIFVSDNIMAGMAQGGISNTAENSIKSLKEVLRAQLLHGAKYPTTNFIFAAIRVYIRYGLQIFLTKHITYKLIDFARRLCGMPPYWTKL